MLSHSPSLWDHRLVSVHPLSEADESTLMKLLLEYHQFLILGSRLSFCFSLIVSTTLSSEKSSPCCFAVAIKPRTSLGKQLPPYPAPAWRNRGPMRSSRPMPRATSLISAPVFSHSRESSFINEILVASIALAAYLIISALLMSVKTIGLPIRWSG